MSMFKDTPPPAGGHHRYAAKQLRALAEEFEQQAAISMESITLRWCAERAHRWADAEEAR